MIDYDPNFKLESSPLAQVGHVVTCAGVNMFWLGCLSLY